MFRRLRAALSPASLWAAVWLPAGVVLGLLFGWTGHSWRLPLWYPVIWTLVGVSRAPAFAPLLAALGRSTRSMSCRLERSPSGEPPLVPQSRLEARCC